LFILNIKLYEDKIDTFINNKVYNLIDRKVINKIISIRGVHATVETFSDNSRVFKQIVKTGCVKSLKVVGEYGDDDYNDETGLPITDVTNEDVSGGSLFVKYQGSTLLSINDKIILEKYNLNDSFNRSNENGIYEPPFVTDGNLVNPGYHTIIHSLPNPNINIPNYISKSLADPLINQPSIFGGTLPPNPWPPTTFGCTDPSFISYNPEATHDDGTCNNNIYGCIDPSMRNYNPQANVDDGSCIDYIRGCVDPTATNYNSTAEADDGSCEYPPVLGCTDPLFEEYDQNATQDDGSCTTARELLTQVIPIQHSWNFFSTFINLSDEPYSNYSPGDFFANHVYYTSDPSQAVEQNRVSFNVATNITTAEGEFWTPEYAQFDRLDNSQGYRVYAELPSDVSEVYMILTGRPVTSNVPSPDTTLNVPSVVTTVELGTQWNLMPVPAYESIDVDDWVDFNVSIDPTFRTSVSLIKDVRGRYWDSREGFRSLERLEPGNAYLTYMNSPATARFEIPAVYGCTDASAINYNSNNQVENGTCRYTSDVSTQEITLPGRDDMGWSQTSFFPNYMISSYIDLNLMENNSIRFIFENYLYDETGTRIPIENIPRYVYRVRKVDGKSFLPSKTKIDPYDDIFEYDPSNDWNWNTGEVLIFETAVGQNEAFSLRIPGTVVRELSLEITGDEFTNVFNILPIIATASLNIPDYLEDSIGVNSNVSRIIDQVSGDSYVVGSSADDSLILQPGKGYFVVMNSNDSSFTLNRAIEVNELNSNEAAQYLPQRIRIPNGVSWISSYLKMYNPSTNSPYSIHEIIYNNIVFKTLAGSYTKLTIPTISSSIEYVALPSYSESFEKWPTSSFATPNTDLKWDYTDGRGFMIKNNDTFYELYLELNSSVIHTDGDFTISDYRHQGDVNQTLIGAFCLEPTALEDYFEPTLLVGGDDGWVHHISSSDNTYWTASGPTAPGDLTHITPGNAYIVTTHNNDALNSNIDGPVLNYGKIPVIVDNPELQIQTLTTDEINYVDPEEEYNDSLVAGNSPDYHVIDIKQGWNMISTYIDTSKFSQPSQSLDITDTSIWANNVFSNDNVKVSLESLDNTLIVMKDNNGAAAIFEYEFSGLGNWQSNQGYQLKAHQPCKFIFEGESCEPVWELTEGWNMVNWPHWDPFQVRDAISSEYWDKILVIKNNDGKAYLPEWDYDGIKYFIPGQGYQIKTTQAFTLSLNVNS